MKSGHSLYGIPNPKKAWIMARRTSRRRLFSAAAAWPLAFFIIATETFLPGSSLTDDNGSRRAHKVFDSRFATPGRKTSSFESRASHRTGSIGCATCFGVAFVGPLGRLRVRNE